MNQFRKSLTYLEKADEINDEIFNEENTRKLTQLEDRFEFEKEKQQLAYDAELKEAAYNRELARQRITLWGVIGGLLAVMGFSVVLWKMNRDKRRTNAELNHINVRLEELNEEKNTIIGIVAHDLKSPVHQINGLIDVSRMKFEKDIPNELNIFFDKMKESVIRSSRMIDRILDINAIESKRIQVAKERIQVRDVFEKAKEVFDLQVREKSITCECLEHANPFILTDRMMLMEVLENLISNAIKFSEPHTKITLSVDAVDGFVELKVQDEGPGINEADQKRLFQKYETLSARPTGDENSSGLGLSIVKRYLDEMGGTISVDSQLGKGTTFTIRFPEA